MVIFVWGGVAILKVLNLVKGGGGEVREKEEGQQ
jgi:hypothetical protein